MRYFVLVNYAQKEIIIEASNNLLKSELFLEFIACRLNLTLFPFQLQLFFRFFFESLHLIMAQKSKFFNMFDFLQGACSFFNY